MEQTNIEQKSSIKLIKNTKGYNYEIKIYCQEEDGKGDAVVIGRLQLIEEQLKKKYGGENE